MIDLSTARALVEQELAKQSLHQAPEDQLVIIDAEPLKDDLGWIFFYNTRAFFETNDPKYGLFGNAPIIVDKDDGSFHYTGTALPIEEYIEVFRKKKLARR